MMSKPAVTTSQELLEMQNHWVDAEARELSPRLPNGSCVGDSVRRPGPGPWGHAFIVWVPNFLPIHRHLFEGFFHELVYSQLQAFPKSPKSRISYPSHQSCISPIPDYLQQSHNLSSLISIKVGNPSLPSHKLPHLDVRCD